MSTPSRLTPPFGSFLNRGRPLSFQFEGRAYAGYEGDTIASALAANGVWLLSSSFKYHRPRGSFNFWGHDAGAWVQIGAEPNVQADRRPLADAMVVRPMNVTGSLARDWGSLIEPFAKFLPVGFYYKAFYKPIGAWRLWENVIRNRAGLGTVDTSHQRGYFDKAYGWCDVAVIGGGPAGLAAAINAAEAGAEVILIDDHPQLGGALNWHRFHVTGIAADEIRAWLLARLDALDNVRVLTGATCTGWFADHYIAVIEGSRLHKLRARATVVATGEVEQPLICGNNDRPGVISTSAASRLARLWGVRPGKHACVIAGHDDAYGAALDLADAGVDIAAIVELRETRPDDPRALEAQTRGLRILPGHGVRTVLGKYHVNAIEAARITGRGKLAPSGERIPCDTVCVGVGSMPTAHLLCHAGARLRHDADRATFVVDDIPDGLFAAGSVNGIHELDAVVADGRRAGAVAARGSGSVPRGGSVPRRGHPWPIFPHASDKSFVDFDEDVLVDDIDNAVADGFAGVELLKRYTTSGMGPSQGRHSALNTSRLAARAAATPAAEIAATTWRPPYMPESMGHLAGRGFQPVRLTPMHDRHVEAGATMMVAGEWLRPSHYPDPGGGDAAIGAEALAVRQGVGLIDVSTLGGLEVRGPDAAEFMNRIYTFAYLKQPVGRARYVLMCDQTGVVVDDGVACRLHDQHFYVTATTGGAAAVYRHMLHCNAQWRLDVDVTNVAAAWCGVNLAGPRSREVLARLCDDVDLSAQAFPYLGVRAGIVAGVPVRLIRIGFVGELGYEIHAPAGMGEALWDAIIDAGRDVGLRPFGVEAQRLLRLEKGHIIIGQDTDGLTTPAEAAMNWAVSRKKPFFVGGRSIAAMNNRPMTRQLVGFEVTDDPAPAIEECHLVLRDGQITGRVTSVATSPTLRRTIGMAYVAPDQSEPNTPFTVKAAGGRHVRCRVVSLPFYDRENARQEL